MNNTIKKSIIAAILSIPTLVSAKVHSEAICINMGEQAKYFSELYHTGKPWEPVEKQLREKLDFKSKYGKISSNNTLLIGKFVYTMGGMSRRMLRSLFI